MSTIIGAIRVVLTIYAMSLALLKGRLVEQTYEKKTELLQTLAWAKADDELAEGLPEDITRAELSEGFWIEEDETVYFLDTYGMKVLKLFGDKVEEIPLSESWLPGDIVCLNEKIYIYDELRQELQVYKENGDCVLRCEIDLENDYVKGLKKEVNEVVVVTYGGKELYIADRQTGQLKSRDVEDVTFGKSGDYEFSEMIGTDRAGNTYFLNTNLVEGYSILAGELVLSGIAPDGNVIGEYRLPLEDCSYLPQRYIQVLEDGRIYLQLSKKGKHEIWQITLQNEITSKMSQIKKDAKALESDNAWETKNRAKKGNVSSRTVVLFTREEAQERVDTIVNHEWYLIPTAIKTVRYNEITFPRYISKMTEGYSVDDTWKIKMTGIPYCWGGSNSMYTNLTNDTFDLIIKYYKFLAGNIMAKGVYKDFTAGLDCSGFVSTVYNIKPRLSTSQLSDLGVTLGSLEELQNMDMLVSAGNHVVLFRGWLDEGAILVSEAAVRDGKTVTHPKTINELLVNGESRDYQLRSPWYPDGQEAHLPTPVTEE